MAACDKQDITFGIAQDTCRSRARKLAAIEARALVVAARKSGKGGRVARSKLAVFRNTSRSMGVHDAWPMMPQSMTNVTAVAKAECAPAGSFSVSVIRTDQIPENVVTTWRRPMADARYEGSMAGVAAADDRLELRLGNCIFAGQGELPVSKCKVAWRTDVLGATLYAGYCKFVD